MFVWQQPERMRRIGVLMSMVESDPQLHVLGLLTAIDVMVLAAYCQACGRWQQAEDALAAMAESDPESGAAHGHDRHRQLDAKPYASGCAECKQLLLDQLQQPAFLRFIASSSNEHQYLLFDMRTSCRAFYQSDQPQRASSR